MYIFYCNFLFFFQFQLVRIFFLLSFVLFLMFQLILLLHDYFLYDWHFKDLKNPHKLHGFYHPSRALHNAQKEYTLTKRQEDIIKKHMWPLTVVPPMCREAWIVTAADKYCSFMETVHLHKGKIKIRKGILKIQSI